MPVPIRHFGNESTSGPSRHGENGFLVHGVTKRWLSWDPERVTTAAALSHLADPPGEQCWVLTVASGIEATHEGAGYGFSDDVSLCLWVPNDPEQIAAVAVSVRKSREKFPGRRRIIYLPESTADQRLLLAEAGAQIMARQLPFLLRSLARVMTMPGNSICGSHVFTRGLLDRLPWPTEKGV